MRLAVNSGALALLLTSRDVWDSNVKHMPLIYTMARNEPPGTTEISL